MTPRFLGRTDQTAPAQPAQPDAPWPERVRDELRGGRFVLWAQPIFTAGATELHGYEILLRASIPSGEVVSAGEFIALAELLGAADLVDRWVVECGDRYSCLAPAGRRVSINLSAATLAGTDAAFEVMHWLGHTSLRPEQVVFEITETAPSCTASLAARCRELVDHGFEVSIDDYGAGHSTDERLAALPCHEVKLAGSLVAELETSAAARAVVEALLRTARAGAVRTVAEGVEDERMLRLVTDLGVDLVQGFHLGVPQPVPSFVQP